MAVAALALPLAGVAGCINTPSGGGATTTTPSGDAGRVATTATSVAPIGSQERPFAWGSVSHRSGVDISVAAPTDYRPGSTTGTPAPNTRGVALAVTLANHSDQPYIPTGPHFLVMGSADRGQAEEVEDAPNGVDEQTAAIPPGQSRTLRVAFRVPAPARTLELLTIVDANGLEPIVFAGPI